MYYLLKPHNITVYINHMTSNLKKLILLFCIFLITSCGIYRPTDARKVSPNPEERVKKILKKVEGLNCQILEKEVLIFSLLALIPYGERV